MNSSSFVIWYRSQKNDPTLFFITSPSSQITTFNNFNSTYFTTYDIIQFKDFCDTCTGSSISDSYQNITTPFFVYSDGITTISEINTSSFYFVITNASQVNFPLEIYNSDMVNDQSLFCFYYLMPFQISLYIDANENKFYILTIPYTYVFNNVPESIQSFIPNGYVTVFNLVFIQPYDCLCPMNDRFWKLDRIAFYTSNSNSPRLSQETLIGQIQYLQTTVIPELFEKFSNISTNQLLPIYLTMNTNTNWDYQKWANYNQTFPQYQFTGNTC